MSNTQTVTLEELLFASVPSAARNIVIEASVTVERVISIMLAMFLDIERESSKSLGNSAQALSFNHKLNLLMDLKIIGKEEKKLLTHFSEIRNVFAHNAAVTHFFQCFNNSDLRKNLEKKYGIQKSVLDIEEENCKMLFELLFADVKQVCRDLFHKMMNRAGSKGEKEGILIFYECLSNILENMCQTDAEFKYKISQAKAQASVLFFEKIGEIKP